MNLKWIKFCLEEIKFLKSYEDFRNLHLKATFFMPRLTNRFVRDTEIPLSLQLEPTNYCNLKCISCPRDRMGRKKGYLEFNLFKKIIDEATKIGVKRVHLYLHGEPMLHPEIVQMINYIKSRGMAFNITTNGMVLDEKKIEAILFSGVNSADYITFSVLGASKEVHEKVMKGVDHYRVVENIKSFLELRKKYAINGPIIEVIFYKMYENQFEIEQFKKSWKGVVDHVLTVDKISRSFANFKLDDNSIQPRNKSCKNIWEKMTIYWNGDVTVCCEDVDGYHILGNLKDKSIKEIWNCNRMLAIKKLHKENKFKNISLCSKCDQ